MGVDATEDSEMGQLLLTKAFQERGTSKRTNHSSRMRV